MYEISCCYYDLSCCQISLVISNMKGVHREWVLGREGAWASVPSISNAKLPFHSCLGPPRTWFLPRWIPPALLYKVLSWNGRWRRPVASNSTWFNYIITYIAQLISLFWHKQPMTACCSTLKYSSSARCGSCSTLQKTSTSPSSTCIDCYGGDLMYVLHGGYIYSSSISFILTAACLWQY